MRQVWFLAVLMVLSPPAHAGSFSFSIGGHRIHVESSRYCRSTSCASVSISGIYSSRRNRDRDDDDRDSVDLVKTPPAPMQPVPLQPAPPQPAPVIAAVPAKNVPVQPTVVAPPPAVFKPASIATQIVAAPALVQPAAIAPPPVKKWVEVVRPAPAAAPQISKVSHEVEEEAADTPVGDWWTEGKGSVRIVKCGQALCGYVLNTSSDDRGEAVLINMKPKTEKQWTGSVYSHDSGDTYYGTMDFKGPNTLRVEACALGRFYCSGNNWTRIVARNEPMVSSRQTLPEPRS